MLVFSRRVVLLHSGFWRRIRLSKIGVRKPRKRKYSKISCLPVPRFFFRPSNSQLVWRVSTCFRVYEHRVRYCCSLTIIQQAKINLVTNLFILHFVLWLQLSMNWRMGKLITIVIPKNVVKCDLLNCIKNKNHWDLRAFKAARKSDDCAINLIWELRMCIYIQDWKYRNKIHYCQSLSLPTYIDNWI